MTYPNHFRGGAEPLVQGSEADIGGCPSETAPVVVDATPLGVRQALAEMRARFTPASPGPDMLGMAETVMAEVLNNIVEHAYGRGCDGPIELRMRRGEGRLLVDVRDFGVPMPDGVIPCGTHPAEENPEDDPPEGGFGWFLIRALARDLEYSRENDQNRLSFYVPLGEA